MRYARWTLSPGMDAHLSHDLVSTVEIAIPAKCGRLAPDEASGTFK
jgi:hypothetical protein